jgi:hypothetical protein
MIAGMLTWSSLLMGIWPMNIPPPSMTERPP